MGLHTDPSIHAVPILHFAVYMNINTYVRAEHYTGFSLGLSVLSMYGDFPSMGPCCRVPHNHDHNMFGVHISVLLFITASI